MLGVISILILMLISVNTMILAVLSGRTAYDKRVKNKEITRKYANGIISILINDTIKISIVAIVSSSIIIFALVNNEAILSSTKSLLKILVIVAFIALNYCVVYAVKQCEKYVYIMKGWY